MRKAFPLKFIYVVIFLFLLTLISYGQTIFMYFLIDDNAAIYKLQHFHQNVGLWGRGLFGEGPYRHIVDQFLPFYPLFGINPMPYFAIGVLVYFLAAISIYIFLKILTKSNLIAFSSSLIFASGYVGSETMFGIVNSWQTARGIIMAMGTLLLFYSYIKFKNLFFYVLSVVLFFFSIDTVFIRAHGLIFAIIAFDLLFWPVRFKWKSILSFIIRQTPFLLVHYYVYLTSSALIQRFGVKHFLEDILIEKKVNLLFTPLHNFGNLLIPDVLSSRMDQIFSQFIHIPLGFYPSATFAGIALFLTAIYLFFSWRDKEPLLTRLLLFSLIWIIGNMVVYFTRETSLVLNTTHRYLTYSFVGLSLFWVLLAYFIFQRTKKISMFILFTGCIVTTYIGLGIHYQYIFNQNRSFPAKRFFSAFDKAVPNIPKGAVLYFDVINNNQIKAEFGSFFGGIFSEGANLSIYSEGVDYMNDFIFTYKFEDILKLLKEKKSNLDKVYAFYYGKQGLIDNTSNVRQILEQGKIVDIDLKRISSVNSYITDQTFSTETRVISNEKGSTGFDPKMIIEVSDLPSIVPSKLEFEMKVSPKTAVILPYVSEGNNVKVSSEQRNKIFDFLSSQKNFYEQTEATSASFWRDQIPKFAIDGRADTAWRGHRGFWDEIDRGRLNAVEYISLDLKRELTLSELIWASGFYQLVPTQYRILTSLDGKNWNKVLEVNKRQFLQPGTATTNSFKPKVARFIKIEFLKTYENDGPEIQEIEVVEDQFTNLDKGLIEQVKNKPFAIIETEDEYSDVMEFIKKNAKVRFWWMSDSEDSQDPNKYIDLQLRVDGQAHTYTVDLPASGQNWIKFTLEGFNFPTDISIGQMKLIYQSI